LSAREPGTKPVRSATSRPECPFSPGPRRSHAAREVPVLHCGAGCDPARPDVWGAREGDLPGLPDRLPPSVTSGDFSHREGPERPSCSELIPWAPVLKTLSRLSRSDRLRPKASEPEIRP
jgi:hypothetical protein